MKMPIKVSSFKDCIPKKNVWYEYAETIFISVMRKPNPYIRRKSRIDDNKIDNSMSKWHIHWQYEVIETIYGYEKYQIKSFEYSITVENQRHIIDSKVENIAIEFQHTLSVDIEEINSRYNAHSTYGLTPYLVIDLTSYSYQDFKDLYDFEFKKKLEKWFECDYALNDNLFIDLEDTIVRIIKTPGVETYKIDKEYFADNLLKLEKELSDKILIYNLTQKRKQIRELISKRRKFVEYERYKSKESKKHIFNQLSAKEKGERDYIKRKNKSKDFALLRKCFSNPVIKPSIDLYRDEIFDHSSESKNVENNILKIHLYKSRSSNLIIECVEHIEVSRKQKPTISGYELVKLRNTAFTEIKLKKNNSILAEFKWETGKIPEIIDNNQISLF